jgi:GT2 family glycosyltransferase
MSLILVTVVRDDLEGLIRTQASISQQSKTVDWIVVSPAEPTSTYEYLEFILQEGKLQRLIQDLGSGIYSAMNLAIHETNKNDWLWFMNAGDEFANRDTVSLVIDAIEKTKSNWIFGGHILGSQSGKILGRHPAPPKFKRKNQLFARKYISHQSTIFKNSFLRELGGFDESYFIASDWDLIARASFTDSGYRIDSDLVIFYMGGFSTKQRQKSNLELLQIRRKQLPLNYFVKNYLWFGYRFIRNSIVVKAEFHFPHFLDRIRSNRISLQRSIGRLFVRKP